MWQFGLRTSLPFGLSCLLALGACGGATHQNGMAPPGDFNNPDPIVVKGGKGGSSAATGGNGGNGIDSNTCANGRANTTRVQPRVILVLDGSCSMSTNYPANGAQSASDCSMNPNGRWAALRNALIDPTNGVVPKLQSLVQFGLVIFGTQPKCPIPDDPVMPALNNFTALQGKIPMVQPGEYTPTGPALDYVYDNLITDNGPDQNLGPEIVILATDGEPNSCGGGRQASSTNYQPAIDAVTKGAGKGVTTYIISLADSAGDFHDHLQQLANIGNPSANGAAMLYTPSSPQELEDSLSQLVGGAVGCDIALNGTIETGSECSGSVTLNGQALTCNGADGWKLIDASHIRLQGAACKKLTDMNGQVEATFPCNIFVPG